MATVADKLAADIREVDGNHNMGAGALAESLIARGWRAPVTKTKYREVGSAELSKVGDLVRSRWSSSGAVWRITAVSAERDTRQKRIRDLTVESLSGGRIESRFSREMNLVVAN